MADGGYVLGHSAAELDRLQAQAEVKNPITRRFLAAAGVGPGMRVLDVGSGAGDVALLLAEVVGSTGEVVGIDRSEVGLATARARVAARALTNVSFVAGSATDARFDEPFDAVVGRYVLQFQPDPAAMVRAVAAYARPGAPIVFHELDWSGTSSSPPAPSYDRLCRWCAAVVEQSGASAHMGMALAAAFVAAGLPEPELRLESLIAGPAHARTQLGLIRGIARTLSASAAASAIAAPDDIGDIGDEALLDLLHDEVVANNSVIAAHWEIGAWARA